MIKNKFNMMKKQKLSTAEFYQKYWCTQIEEGKREHALIDADIEFFNMVEKAQKDGKELIIHRGQRINCDFYIHSLTQTAMHLTEGNKVCLLSQKSDKFIADLKKFFNIDVNIEPNIINNEIQDNSYIVTIKKY